MQYQDLKPGQHYMSVTQGMRGWFACEFWMNDQEPDIGCFLEPWQSDPCSFATKEEAAIYARALAEELDLPYIE